MVDRLSFDYFDQADAVQMRIAAVDLVSNTCFPALAAEVGRRRFPQEAAELIATVVERDVPFYDPVISPEAVAGLNRFAQSVGRLPSQVGYEQVVAVRFRDLWPS